jgi:RNA polymerase sigma factor (sigma-70 family)
MDQPPDSLLDRLRRDGSRQDWERFVDLYGPLLELWARRLLRADDAADLVQDVLLRVMQRLPSFAGEGDHSFLTWLRAVLRNRWRDLRRRGAAQPRTAGSAALDAFAGADDLAGVITADPLKRNGDSIHWSPSTRERLLSTKRCVVCRLANGTIESQLPIPRCVPRGHPTRECVERGPVVRRS